MSTAIAVAATVARKQATSGGTQALAGKAALSTSAKGTLVTTNGISLNFTGTNGAAPPSPLTNIFTTSGSTGTIQSNQLRYHLGTIGGYGDQVIYGFTPASQNFTISADIELNATTGEQFARLIWRADSSGNDDYFEYGIDAGGNVYLSAGTRAGFTQTSLGGIGGLSITGATILHVKIDCRGTTFKVRYWLDGAAEPGTWNLLDTTSSTYTTGQIAIISQGGNAAATHDHDWDNFVVAY
jgi:hypothetical protein